jgi:hypothetical protein
MPHKILQVIIFDKFMAISPEAETFYSCRQLFIALSRQIFEIFILSNQRKSRPMFA